MPNVFEQFDTQDKPETLPANVFDQFISEPQDQPQSRQVVKQQSTVDQLRGKSLDVDYKTGAPFTTLLDFNRAQNPEEAKLALEKHHGKGNAIQDERGRWLIKTPADPMAGDQQKVAVEPSGSIGSGLKNLAAGMGSAATPMAGATLGMALGALAGLPGMVIGAGIGAGGGLLMDQLVKYYRGLYEQSPHELVKHTANEAALNIAFAGAIPAARTLTRGVGNAFREWVGTTPTTRSMTERLVDEGARPPIASAAPNFKSFGDKQILRNMVLGDPGEAQNVAYLQKRFSDSLKSSGLDDAQISRIMAEAANPVEAPSSVGTGQLISQGVQQRVGEIASEAQTARQFAEKQLRGAEQALRQYADQPVGRLGQVMSDEIVARRREFGQAASRAYSAIDASTGDAKIVPLDGVFRAARGFVDLAEPGLVPPYVKALADRGQRVELARTQIAALQARNLPIPEQLAQTASEGLATFAEGHELRSNLREILGHGVDLTRTPYMHKIADVEEALNSTFKQMESSGTLGADAVKSLRNVDKMYGQGIAKFYDAQINKIVRDTRSGLIPDAETVVASIVRDGRTESLNQILSMVPPHVREDIAKVNLRNMVQDASYRSPEGHMVLDGSAFLDQLDRPTVKSLYSPKQLSDMRRMGTDLAALDGKIDVTNLPPSQVTNAIRTYIQHTKEIDAFVKGNPIAKFANGRPEEIDRAAKVLTTPGNEAETVEAARFFGIGSKQWESLQQHAIRGLVRSAIVETPSRVTTISGPAIERVLKKYTLAQQELLFPAGLADDLKQIAKEARFLFPPQFGSSGRDMSMGIAARAITLNTGIGIHKPRTLNADFKWFGSMVMGWITDRPALLRFLADTSRKDPSLAQQAMGSIARWIANGEAMGPGNARPQVVQP